MAKVSRFGIDHKTGKLHLGRFAVRTPRSRVGRITTGSLLVGGGVLGFLPVLGFWMVPLGLLILSQDVPAVRRKRRRFAVWWHKRHPKADGSSGDGCHPDDIRKP
ncbi:MAG: hypothetical protein ACOH2J_08395 [Allorhizobium sp.]